MQRLDVPLRGLHARAQEALRYIASYSPYERLLSLLTNDAVTSFIGGTVRPYVNATMLRALARGSWPVLITAGLNDQRVPYWGPSKYAALLRALRTEALPSEQAETEQEQAPGQNQGGPDGEMDNGEDRSGGAAAGAGDAKGGLLAGKVLLMVNMGAGHFAVSGASGRLAERALKNAFVLGV